MKKVKQKIFIVTSFLIVIAAASVFILKDRIFGAPVPSNLNTVISSDTGLEMILPQVFGGGDYQEKLFDTAQDKKIWLALCYESIGVDDADDVCRGFQKGYLREYKNYDSVSGAKFTDVKLKLYINEYETAEAAKEAASFLTVDAGMPVMKIDGAGVIGWDIGSSNDSRYTLVADKYLITALGHPAAKEMIREIIKLYRK